MNIIVLLQQKKFYATLPLLRYYYTFNIKYVEESVWEEEE